MDIALENSIENLRQVASPHLTRINNRCCELLLDASTMLDYAQYFRNGIPAEHLHAPLPERIGSIEVEADGAETFFLNVMDPSDYPSEIYAHVFGFLAALCSAHERVAGAIKCWHGLPEDLNFKEALEKIDSASPILQLCRQAKSHVDRVKAYRNSVIHKSVFPEAYREVPDGKHIIAIAFLMPDTPDANPPSFRNQTHVEAFMDGHFQESRRLVARLIQLLKQEGVSGPHVRDGEVS